MKILQNRTNERTDSDIALNNLPSNVAERAREKARKERNIYLLLINPFIQNNSQSEIYKDDFQTSLKLRFTVANASNTLLDCTLPDLPSYPIGSNLATLLHDIQCRSHNLA
jgi:hypothetical protein